MVALKSVKSVKSVVEPYSSNSPGGLPPPPLEPPWFLRPFGSKRHPIGMPSGRLRRRK